MTQKQKKRKPDLVIKEVARKRSYEDAIKKLTVVSLLKHVLF